MRAWVAAAILLAVPAHAKKYATMLTLGAGQGATGVVVSTVTLKQTILNLNPTSFWPMDEGSGSTATDVVAAHNGSVGAGTTMAGGAIVPNGQGGSAKVVTANSTAVITVTDHDDLDLGATGAISYFIKGSCVATFAPVFCKDSGCISNGYLFLASKGGDQQMSWFTTADGAGNEQFQETVDTGTGLRHYAMSWSNGTATVYLNGSAISGASNITWRAPGANAANIEMLFNNGCAGAQTVGFQLSYVAVWKGAGLNAANVSTIWNAAQ